ncbi:chloride channel protein [Anaeromyxobacter diazotrophicus]|uniref:Chloride channel protein n=1 Tax=Anaeromyxobacter diazotrophicus TaxID=2590199 RepID=A0A7I9VL61_9BACT|nr:chloride channel protein [Anaeromyxobacter diazotrophicus]
MRWLAPLGTGGGYESSRRLGKWLLVGIAIGAVAGLGAVAFTWAIRGVTQLGLGTLVGWAPPGPVGEGGAAVSRMARPWLLPVLTTLGGLVSGVLVFGLAPEAEGHGTDAAIEAFHRRGGWIRPRIPLVKLVASAITIGTGGSAGREGPAAQISAGFGALLGHAVLKSPQDRRIAVAAGIGAGIGAIFRAPLGGALLAAEILYLHDMEVEAIIPSLIASIVGYTVYGAANGFAPIFGAHPALELGAPIQLLYYAALGVLSGAGGLLYARTFYRVGDAFHRLALPRWLKPALGGLAVGLLGLALPQVLHTGYGWVQLVMSREGLLAFSPLLILIIPIAKIVATSLSIGSGGSGGIFGPGMVVGGMLGAALWLAGHALGLPSLPPEPAPFVIIGMMALFGGIAHAPLAVMLMVAEMTGTLSLLAPAMIAVAISTAMVGDETIYRAQLRDRASSAFHRARFSVPLLASLAVRDAWERVPLSLSDATPIEDALARLAEAGADGAAITADDGRVVGSVSRDALRRVAPDERTAPVSTATVRVALAPGQTLEEGMQVLTDAGTDTAPVVEAGRAVGLLTSRGVLRAYRTAAGRLTATAALTHA